MTKLPEISNTHMTFFCSKVTPGQGGMALCMLAHEDKISDSCSGVVLDFADGVDIAISNLWRAADVFEQDVDTTCGDIEPGEGRVAQCLIENKSKLSPLCRAEIAGVEARLNKVGFGVPAGPHRYQAGAPMISL